VSLDLSVITDKKITDERMKSVIEFLLANRFRQDEYGYLSEKDNLFISLYIDMEPEKDEFWTDEPPKVVWFTPLFEIALESRHNRESHETSYRIARELAKLLDGFIYDNQVGVVYDLDGQPCDHHGTGERFEKYGAGIGPFMGVVGMMKDILESKQ
jgi:hypothetical protein